MDKINIEDLKKYANDLMFDMTEEEYERLNKRFIELLEGFKKIEEFEGIKDIEPLFFPYEIENNFREDEAFDVITVDDALANAKEVIGREIKVPKVVD